MTLRTLALLVGLGGYVLACSSSNGDNGRAGNAVTGDGGPQGTVDASSEHDGGDGDGQGVIDAGSEDGGTSPIQAGGNEDEAPAQIHIIGRTDERDPDGPRFSWGTQIRTRFSGTGVAITLADNGANWFDVSIDGTAAAAFETGGPAQSYVLAQNLADQEHDLIVTRRTEAFEGDVQFLGITTPEGRDLIATTLPFEHRLEFVGDSVATGFGVLGVGPTCVPSLDNESEPNAYPAFTAAALNASHITIAYSGIGIIMDYNNGTTEQMPERYLRALVNDPSSVWDFSYVPDAVIIDLGTNDLTFSDPGPAFETAYVSFMELVRSKYPAAHIMVTVSPMIGDDDPSFPARTVLKNYLSDVIATRQAAGDANVSMFEFEEQTGDLGYGCSWHPSVAEQQAMSDKLVAALRAQLGW
ncbi:MAG: GDSL-type esterase/lipase family protein [Polyangiaceae bacterium]|nr:GDSL-type esterase/lipase family protein [Polyangiaceae bacterium]